MFAPTINITCYRAVWKIPVGTNMIGNLEASRTRNLAEKLDPSDVRAVSGHGLDQTQVSLHPDTGAPFDGAVLPDWRQPVELVEKAASIFVGLQGQG